MYPLTSTLLTGLKIGSGITATGAFMILSSWFSVSYIGAPIVALLYTTESLLPYEVEAQETIKVLSGVFGTTMCLIVLLVEMVSLDMAITCKTVNVKWSGRLKVETAFKGYLEGLIALAMIAGIVGLAGLACLGQG